MIAFLSGSLFEKTVGSPSTAILDVGGVGYEVFVPLSTFETLPRDGQPCRLLVHDYVREDQHVLFGFAAADERDLFLLLQGVSGIGPKTALSALSAMTVRALKTALVDGDAKSIAKIPGLGKRTAERLIVELKGKIDPPDAAAAPAEKKYSPLSQAYRDAALALVQLGQTEEAAAKAVREIAARPNPPTETPAIVRLALSGR